MRHREIEDDDDWEATGQEEMNSLHARCKQKTSIVDVRDKLNNLRDLVDVCGSALLSHENSGQERIQKHVASVLYFFVDDQLTNIEKELSEV